MNEPEILWQVNGRIATLTLNRPARRNALVPDMLDMAAGHLARLGRDDAAVVVIEGAGPSFCAGVDLNAAASLDAAGRDRFTRSAHELQRLIETIPQPVIAKVRGHCLTGGLEIAIACDLIVAADDARFGDTHALVGFRPRWGMSQRLPYLIGPARAREMVYTGRQIDAAEAARIGLISRHVPAEQLDAAVGGMAEAIMKGNPDSIAAYKDLFRQAREPGFSQGVAYEGATEYAIRRPPT
ncbi:enoyl-CoA hydratase/isomerase family protein [Rhizorhabdus dicambivorans]|uniref:Enoyl-CoA hydratase/isomerase family protein n=1 Tax=Rhizorhabdus dicambivorans TaxID=1850238 RepID=A0A2A4FQX5_9SPHN|nr:enoyl-CoA hydratase/isomerase family protein [Rhizorhabdus dicambivorans]ATE64274.1 enoyl-CoA hydratase/isomerase family protein [Rhizorhabdus dicambivorans]PCE40567.1 enoyl-CoA hydratase/isomerase family protein [Rhizorhabdus dicambivorans]